MRNATQPSTSCYRRLFCTLHVYLGIAILFTNYFLAQYDKFILSYFQASILESLSLTGPQYALLSGYSTGIVYALLALPVAFVADYTSARVWVLSSASAWWSLCVIMQSLARTFAEIYCARLGMGIGQAAVEALSVSLVSDLVGWRNVFIGESVFYVGVYVGEAISGQIATAFAQTHTSWQVAMRAIGITGIVVAVLLRLLLREPERNSPPQHHGDEQISGEGNSTENLTTTKRSVHMVFSSVARTILWLVQLHSFWLLVISAAMRQVAGNVFGYYMPGYLSAVYATRPDLLAHYGIIVGTVGSVSVLSGGVLTSALWQKTKLTPLYLTAIGGMTSSIFVLLMLFSKDIAGGNEQRGVQILYGSMCAAYITAETWLGCLSTLVTMLLPPAYKTFGLAIWSSIQVLVYSSGPEIIGLSLRNIESGSPEYVNVVKICLSVIIPIGYWICGVGLLLSVPLVRRDLAGESVQGLLSTARIIGIWLFASTLILIVVVLFILSLVYSA